MQCICVFWSVYFVVFARFRFKANGGLQVFVSQVLLLRSHLDTNAFRAASETASQVAHSAIAKVFDVSIAFWKTISTMKSLSCKTVVCPQTFPRPPQTAPGPHHQTFPHTPPQILPRIPCEFSVDFL